MAKFSLLRRLSIRAQMLLLMLAVALPAAAGISWFILAESRDATDAAYLRVKDLADDTASHIDLILSDYDVLFSHLATRAGIKALDSKQCALILSEYLHLHPEFNTLTVRDTRANPVCSSRRNPLPAEDARDSNWFRRGMEGGEFTVGEAELGYFTQRWVSVLTRRILDDSGKAIGVMSLPLDLLKLNRRVLATSSSGAVVTVIDRSGNILLRSIEPEKWIGRHAPAANTAAYREQGTSYALRPGVDGISRLYAYVSVPSTGWRVVTGLPEDEVFATHRRRLMRSIALGLGAMILWSWLAFRISAAIVKPISDLAGVAARVAAGDTAARASVGGPKEIGEVAEEFNRMLEARALANASLRRLSEAVEQSPVSIVITDTAGNIEYVNPKFTRVTGYGAAEALGQNPRILKSGELAEDAYRELWQTITAGGEWSGEFHNKKKNGELFWEHARILPIRDAAGTVLHFLAVKEDITERKRAEDAAREAHEQLRQLTIRLNNVHEAESSLLSRELHDEFGQMLTSLKMDLGWLASQLGENNHDLKEKVAASIALVESSVHSVRSIAARLRPRILDDLGLLPAIEWLVQDFRERSGIDAEVVSNTRARALTPEQATAVFRIVQESLSNIARHAGAKTVDISLDAEEGWLTLEIRDDGKGVREDAMTSYESIGLLGMRERALAAAGELKLESVLGKGTVVTLRLPMEGEAA
ncbi:MAG: PAS domain S-box protein [Proteobacteria bacterium]|nr:PAS domain S-box protein [Pseudomonadota bacterium]